MALRLYMVGLSWSPSAVVVVALAVPRVWVRNASGNSATLADGAALHLQDKLVCLEPSCVETCPQLDALP